MKGKVFLSDEDFEAKFKNLVDTCEYFISGTNSIYVPTNLTSYIQRDVCREWPNLDGEVELMTPGEAARTELKREFPDVELRARKSDFYMLDMPAPIYYDGRRRAQTLYYLDLRGAYWQIYRKLCLDICWPRGLGELQLRPVADVLRDWKSARNAIIGISRSYRITGIQGTRAFERHLQNPFFNPHLWRHVQEILHEIACFAKRCGSVYIATDGYIFLKMRQADYFEGWLNDHAIDYARIDGEGYIHAFGSYGVGHKKTLPQNRTATKLNNLIDEGGTLEWWTKLRESHYDLLTFG